MLESGTLFGVLGHCFQCRWAGAVAWFGNDCHRDVKDDG